VSIYSEELYHKTFSQPPRPEVLYHYLSKHFPKGTYYSVYEAGFSGFWIHNQLQSFGINNIVVNPADIPTTDKEKKLKTDKIDSHKLARQLRSGLLEPIYIHHDDTLQDRSLVRYRKTIVKDLTRNKNRIKSLLNFFGLQVPEGFYRDQKYWSNRYIDWLAELMFTRESANESIALLVQQVRLLRSNLLTVNKQIRKLAHSEYYQKRVELLMSIPGIGLITAMIILTEIDDILRFDNQEKLAAYVGLVPTSHSSGDKDIHGEMMNRGNKYLKPAIIESAWTAARVDPVLHHKFLGHCKRMKKNKATVRIARALLNRICFVLKNMVPYENGID
jgi:transposase